MKVCLECQGFPGVMKQDHMLLNAIPPELTTSIKHAICFVSFNKQQNNPKAWNAIIRQLHWNAFIIKWTRFEIVGILTCCKNSFF